MSDLVTSKNGELLTTSKIIADKFGKAHRKVIRDINELECSEEFRAANFGQSSYRSPQNKVLKCFDITANGFSFLCMGFTGKKAAEWKEKYIKAFDQMRDALTNEPPVTMLALNDLAAKIENDKEVASACGKELAKYKKVKKQNKDDWVKSVNQAQLNLGFDNK